MRQTLILPQTQKLDLICRLATKHLFNAAFPSSSGGAGVNFQPQSIESHLSFAPQIDATFTTTTAAKKVTTSEYQVRTGSG